MQLKQRLDDIYSRGIDSEISHHRELAEAFRAMCDKHGISVVDFPKSNALTTIQFPKSNALEIFAVMKDKYGKMLTPSGGEIGKRVLRVGHLGNNTIEDYEELIKELMEVMA